MVDENNLFSLIVTAANTADAIAKDARQTAGDRYAAERIRDAMSTWKGVAFNFREWKPASKATTGAPTA